MKKKLFAFILSGVLGLASVIPSMTVMADGQKVVTLGADLSEEQKQAILRYFGVAGQNLQTLTITNQDERNHLGSYVPIEQIGTKTFSCALVNPTSSGGIQVKTANLSWVTSNMIAATLSTSGVVNCEVLAAAPFEVSGTGALTGILMAYESAVGATLDSAKKEVATQELITTTQIANSIGQVEATEIVNESKIQIIQGQVVNTGDIESIINEVAEEEQIYLSEEDREMLVTLMEQIADQQYDFEEMQETLERVESNMEAIQDQMYEEDEQDIVEDTSDEYVVLDDGSEMEAPEGALQEDSILMNTDDSALGDSVIFDATDDSAIEEDEDVYDPELDDYDEEEDGFEIVVGDEYSEGGLDDAPVLDDSSVSEEEWAETPVEDEYTEDTVTDEVVDDSFEEVPVLDDLPTEEDMPAEENVPMEENVPAEGDIPVEGEEVMDANDGIATLQLEVIPLSEFIFAPMTSESTSYEVYPAGITELSVYFQRADIIGGSGTLTLYNAADSTQIETITMADPEKVVISPMDQEALTDNGWTEGYEAVIHLEEPLAQNSAYFVILSDDAFSTQDGIGHSEVIPDSYTWVIQTGEFGLAVDTDADGVTAGENVTGTVMMDGTAAVYACIENADPAMVTFDAAEFWSTSSFTATYAAPGTVSYQVSFYDEAGNLLETIPYELEVK